jgi:hypothetical protein
MYSQIDAKAIDFESLGLGMYQTGRLRGKTPWSKRRWLGPRVQECSRKTRFVNLWGWKPVSRKLKRKPLGFSQGGGLAPWGQPCWWYRPDAGCKGVVKAL